jgi:hypothetical protein
MRGQRPVGGDLVEAVGTERVFGESAKAGRESSVGLGCEDGARSTVANHIGANARLAKRAPQPATLRLTTADPTLNLAAGFN